MSELPPAPDTVRLVLAGSEVPPRVFGSLPLPANFDSSASPVFSLLDEHNSLTDVAAVLFSPTLFRPPPPWSTGHFIYRIPWKYRFGTAPTVTHPITLVGREIGIEGPAGPHEAGTVTIVQGAACVTRRPDDTFAPCIGN